MSPLILTIFIYFCTFWFCSVNKGDILEVLRGFFTAECFKFDLFKVRNISLFATLRCTVLVSFSNECLDISLKYSKVLKRFVKSVIGNILSLASSFIKDLVFFYLLLKKCKHMKIYLSLFVYRATDFLRVLLFTLCICFFKVIFLWRQESASDLLPLRWPWGVSQRCCCCCCSSFSDSVFCTQFHFENR